MEQIIDRVNLIVELVNKNLKETESGSDERMKFLCTKYYENKMTELKALLFAIRSVEFNTAHIEYSANSIKIIGF